jgi:CheY-like chemotaxis protein
VRRHGGLGLGLSIVKTLVELHGGEVSVSSEGRGKGSVFRFSLPLLSEGSNVVELEKSSSVHDACLTGVKVLVVDDEADSRELLVRLLMDHGGEVVAAGGVDEALGAVQVFRPDVIVSDIGMPGKDGFFLLKELQRQLSGESVPPAVAVTAFAREEDRERVFQAGFRRHLSKPVDVAELVSAVRQLYDERCQLGQAV